MDESGDHPHTSRAKRSVRASLIPPVAACPLTRSHGDTRHGMSCKRPYGHAAKGVGSDDRGFFALPPHTRLVGGGITIAHDLHLL